MNILLTGANGFLGMRIFKSLQKNTNFKVKATIRQPIRSNVNNVFELLDLTKNTNWSKILFSQNVIIHTAARVHVMKDNVSNPLEEYRRVNVQGTLNLARQSVLAGVKRFIFISSVKVNGEETFLGKPFTEEDKPSPRDPYSLSKWEAEQGLRQIEKETGLEVVIIRPPLVYGPFVKGNFANMIKFVVSGVPLPFGKIFNKRSLIAIDNLVDLIITCIDHPNAANQLFLVSDGKDLSTTELLKAIGKAKGISSKLIPIPVSILLIGFCLIGKKFLAQKLLCSLQVDISKAYKLLGWTPLVSIEEGLKRCFHCKKKVELD